MASFVIKIATIVTEINEVINMKCYLGALK